MRIGRKLQAFIGAVIIMALLMGMFGCASSQQSYESAAFLGAVGAGAGALLDKNNRWRGAVLGGAAGAATGYGLSEIQQRNERHYYRPY